MRPSLAWRIASAGALLVIVAQLPGLLAAPARNSPLRTGGDPRPALVRPPELHALVDELIAELDAAPTLAHTGNLALAIYTTEILHSVADDGDDHHLSTLTTKLERWVNGYGVTVNWLSACPIEPTQIWVGIYESTDARIRICPLNSAAERFDVLLHESGHLLQDRVFRHSFDQHEADAISWVVQRALGLRVAFSTTDHMRAVYRSTSQDIRRQRETIVRGAQMILEGIGQGTQ